MLSVFTLKQVKLELSPVSERGNCGIKIVAPPGDQKFRSRLKPGLAEAQAQCTAVPGDAARNGSQSQRVHAPSPGIDAQTCFAAGKQFRPELASFRFREGCTVSFPRTELKCHSLHGPQMICQNRVECGRDVSCRGDGLD